MGWNLKKNYVPSTHFVWHFLVPQYKVFILNFCATEPLWMNFRILLVLTLKRNMCLYCVQLIWGVEIFARIWFYLGLFVRMVDTGNPTNLASLIPVWYHSNFFALSNKTFHFCYVTPARLSCHSITLAWVVCFNYMHELAALVILVMQLLFYVRLTIVLYVSYSWFQLSGDFDWPELCWSVCPDDQSSYWKHRHQSWSVALL